MTQDDDSRKDLGDVVADVKPPKTEVSNGSAEKVARAICRSEAIEFAWGEFKLSRVDAYVEQNWEVSLGSARAAIDAYEAHLKASGLAIVPLEPGEDAYNGLTRKDELWRNMNSTKVYRAMVAAADLIGDRR